MRKKLAFGGLFLLALVIIGALVRQPKNSQQTSDCLGLPGRRCDVHLEYARDQEQRERGLSGRDGLAQNQGMLFVFTTTADQCMWMKGMKFNLDIIWLSERKTVTHIEKNLSPNTYPQSYCASAKYVVELPAGSVDRFGLKDYQQFDFSNN